MAKALHALLNGIIDYAGMFPPAKLSLEESLSKYLQCRAEPDSWLLNRFVCPAEKLREVSTSAPIPITALGRSSEGNLLEQVRTDLADIAACEGKLETHAWELRFPGNLWGPRKVRDAAGLFAAVGEIVESSSTPRLTVFYEIPSSDLSTANVRAFAETLSIANQIAAMKKMRQTPSAGVKLRCGDNPAAKVVARVIAACASRRLRLKFTAGLHHPLRQAGGHGFLNVFAAGVFAHRRRFDESRLEEVLETKAAQDFIFSENELRWRDITVTTAEIEATRKELVTSFGSCSFDEPRDGLRALKLLN